MQVWKVLFTLGEQDFFLDTAALSRKNCCLNIQIKLHIAEIFLTQLGGGHYRPRERIISNGGCRSAIQIISTLPKLIS